MKQNVAKPAFHHRSSLTSGVSFLLTIRTVREKRRVKQEWFHKKLGGSGQNGKVGEAGEDMPVSVLHSLLILSFNRQPQAHALPSRTPTADG
jgi:hypothetical protein